MKNSNKVFSRRNFLSLAVVISAVSLAGGLSACGERRSSELSSDSSRKWLTASEKPEYSGPVDPSSYSLQSTTLFAFDTVVDIQAFCNPDILGVLAARCQYFERIFSRTVEGSDIWRLNNAGGAFVSVSKDTFNVLSRAVEYGEKTGGIFDVTIGSVTSLWDFEEDVIPADEAVENALNHVDYRCICFDGESVALSDPEAVLDLGGIAKGYIADDLVSFLESVECPSAIINLGGNVYSLGTSKEESPFTVGIVVGSFEREEKLIATIETNTDSVVTSGVYERFFVKDGVPYHHILDSKTGYPVESDLMGVSIVGKSAVEGDVYATTMIVMGAQRALSWAREDGIEMLLARCDGVVESTSERFTVLV